MNPIVTFPGLGLGPYIMNKVAFTVFGWSIMWYALIIAFGYILAVIYVIARSKKFDVKGDDLVDLLLWATPIAIIGARAMYVTFNFRFYEGHLDEIYKIWQGGLAIYGAIIASVIVAAIFTKKRGISFWAVMDVCSLGLLIGQAIGRWGNFVNCEAFGIVTDLPWRMSIRTVPVNTYLANGVHPTFFYEFAWNTIGFIILHFYSRKKRKFKGEIFLMYSAWYGLGRAIIETFRADSLYFFPSSIKVSQVIAAAAFVAGVLILIYIYVKKPYKSAKTPKNALGASVSGIFENDMSFAGLKGFTGENIEYTFEYAENYFEQGTKEETVKTEGENAENADASSQEST